MIRDGLLTDSVIIRRRSAGGDDRYGNPSHSGPVWDPDPTPARIEPINSRRDGEANTVNADQVTDQRTMWLKPDVGLDANDHVVFDGRIWQVMGRPHVHTGSTGPHHLEAVIQLTEDVDA